MNSAGETTATALAKMRRWAKEQARTTGVSYSAALEQAAKNAGFASWHDARTARRHQAPPEVPFELAVDPVLPQDFDQTANESRSKTELEAWWLRPFALTLPGGGYEVRCLDGGAWDRSTWYGHADTLDAARELARRKLQWWLEVRDTPILHLGEATCLLTLEPNRPGLPRPVLHTAATSERAAEFLERWKRIRAEEPTVAALTVQRRFAAGRRAGRAPCGTWRVPGRITRHHQFAQPRRSDRAPGADRSFLFGNTSPTRKATLPQPGSWPSSMPKSSGMQPGGAGPTSGTALRIRIQSTISSNPALWVPSP